LDERIDPMRMMRRPIGAVLIAALLLVAGPAAGQAPEAAARGSVRGRVLDESGGGPLRAAVVEVLGIRDAATVSGGSGEYSLRGVPAGRRVIRARHLGHEPLEIEVVVPAGREVVVDLVLRLAPIVLQPLEVDGVRATMGVDTVSVPRGELGLANARAMLVSPGIAELGLADAAQRVPGPEPPDPTNVLYVRGAAADLKLVYLDGAPVYAPFPLGGLVDAFAPDALSSAAVFLGGAPARYDGGLSYVMDLRTRGGTPGALRSSGAVDLLSARGALEGGLAPGVAVLAAGRAVHGAGTMEPVPYNYAEGLVRADISLPGGAGLHLTGFTNEEEVALDDDPERSEAVTWGNAAAAARLVGRFAGHETEITLSRGSFQARVPRADPRSPLLDGSALRSRIAADLTREAASLLFRYGLSLDRMTHRYQARLEDGATTGASVTGDAAGAYIDLSWRPIERVRMRAGVRGDHFALEPKFVVAPRLAVTFLATERAAITVAGGKYHQYVRAPEGDVLFRPAGAEGAPPVKPLGVGESSHLAVSLDQDLGEGTRLGLEGFYKTFRNVPMGASNHATSSGVDLWMRRDSGSWTGWAGYSLAWLWTGGDGIAADRFSGRHLLTAGFGASIGDQARLETSFSYGAGLPYAAIPLLPPGYADAFDVQAGHLEARQLSNSADSPPLIPAPDRPYLRLDLSGTHTWEPTWRGRDVRIATYLKLLNTLGQRDALFYRYDGERQLRALGAIPVVPVVGLEWKF
jgi:hypothetical protein